MSTLYALDETLDYLNGTSLCDEMALLEFSIKDTIHNMIEKVKQALVHLIEKIQNALSKGKDNKVKSALNSLLTKAKAALTKTKNIKEDDDESKIRKMLDDIKSEVGEISYVFRFISPAVTKVDELTLTMVKDYIKSIDPKKQNTHMVSYSKDILTNDNFNKLTSGKYGKDIVAKYLQGEENVVICISFFEDEKGEPILYGGKIKKWRFASVDDKLAKLIASGRIVVYYSPKKLYKS